MNRFFPYMILAAAIATTPLSSLIADDVAEGVAEILDDDAAMPPAPKTPAEVLYGTLSRLPSDPVKLTGSLIMRKRRGIVVKEVPFEIELLWGAEPKGAKYRLFDGFGRPLSTLVASVDKDGRVLCGVRDGDGRELPEPDLLDQVEGTDITWLDITLSYLWWNDATLVGAEEFKGALCDIVAVRPPSPLKGCAEVRLWVDRRRGFLRQAEQIDEKGERVRHMWVASVGKIGDRWMIRNMEVKREGTGVMTKLHVDTLE
ncbi:MAG: outer membrane lipoprotein-sorting protein [Kiritimatiellae bacterium]|nr:outer membrane lipoprotein-sorting protein [Kiritimatiellia bacterium]